MSCQRARELDLDAYLVDPSAPEWSDFKAHFPHCEDCAAVMASATTFEMELAEALGTSHASPDQLLAIAGRGGTLPRMERASVEQHLGGCARCRDSLRAFERFEIEGLAAPERSGDPSRRSVVGRLREWWAGLAESLVPSHPAWAAAGVAILVVALVGTFTLRRTPGSGDATPIARIPALARPPSVRPEPESPGVEESPVYVAEVPPATSEEPSAPEVHLARETQDPASPVERRPETDPRVPGPAIETSSESLLIAMAQLPSPSYLEPDASQAGMRVHEVLRSAEATRPELQVLAPEHVGRTVEESPTLYWFVDRPLERPVRFTLLDEEGGDFFEVSLGESHAAGIHAVSLDEHGQRLALGRLYSWFVSLPTQPEGAHPDVLSGGAIERIPMPESITEVRVSRPARLGHAYAEAGLWYDALAAFSHSIESGAPPGVHDHRAALLDQVELAVPAAFDRKSGESS